MTKKFFFLFVTVFGLSYFISDFTLQADTPSLESKFKQLSERYQEHQTLEQETLSIPLLSSNAAASAGISDGISFMEETYTVGHEGNLTYEQTETGGFHLRYQNAEKDATFYFNFNEPLDLRNRWFRLRYSGLHTPGRITLKLDPADTKKDLRFALYLENSTAPEYVLFKVPDKIPYDQIHSLRMIFEPEDPGDKAIDFTIQGVEILPLEQSPFTELPSSNLMRFDWYAHPRPKTK